MLTQKSTSIIVILVVIVSVSTGKCSEAGNWFTKSLDYYSLEKCSPLDKSNMAGDFNACMNSPVDPTSTPATASASGKTGGWGASGGASSGGFSTQSAKGFNFQSGSNPGSSSSTKQSTGDSWPISLISELQQIVNCFPKLLKPCMTESEQDFYLTIRDFFQAQIDYGSANASSIAKKISSSGCLKSNSIDTSTICFSTNVNNQNWFGWKINWIDGQMCHFINDISTCEVKSFDKCPPEVKQFAVGLWEAGLKVTPCLKQTDETTVTTTTSSSSSLPVNSNQNVPVSKVTSSQVSGPVKLKASKADTGRADKALNDQPNDQPIKNQDQFEADSDSPYKRSNQRDKFGRRKNLFENDDFQADSKHSKLVRLHEVDGEGESRRARCNRHKGVSEEQWTRIKEEYRRKMRESEESRESGEDEYEKESEESDEDKISDIIGYQLKRKFSNPHFRKHQQRNSFDQKDDYGEYYRNGLLRIRRNAADDAKDKEEMDREKKADEAERAREEAEKQREIDEEKEEELRQMDEEAEESKQDEEERLQQIEEEKREAEEAKNEKKKGKRFTRSLKLPKKAKKEDEAAEEAREKEQEEKEKEQEEAEAVREEEEEEAEEAREREQEEAEEAREREEQAKEDEEEAAEAAREKEEEEEEKRQELEEKEREAKKYKSKRAKRDIRGRKQSKDYEERDREEQERQDERFLERSGKLRESVKRRLEPIERKVQEGEERLKRIREEAYELRDESNKRRLEALKRQNTSKHRYEDEDENNERRRQIQEADRRKEENERREEEAKRRQSERREDENDDKLILRPQRYGRNNFVNNQFSNNNRNNDVNEDNSEITGSAFKDCIKNASNSWSYVSQNNKHDDIMEIMCRNIDSVHSCLDKHASTNDPSTSHRLNHLKVTHQALCDSNNKPKDLNQVKKMHQCIVDQQSSNLQTSNRQARYPDTSNRRPNWQ